MPLQQMAERKSRGKISLLRILRFTAPSSCASLSADAFSPWEFSSNQGDPSGIIFSGLLWSHPQNWQISDKPWDRGQNLSKSLFMALGGLISNEDFGVLICVCHYFWCFWKAYLYFAQVPRIETEILLLWPRSQGLSLIGRWDQSKPEKMKPLVLPGALYIPWKELL